MADVNSDVMEFSNTLRGMKTIAERLKSARLAAQLSQEALAKKVGVSQGLIGQIEGGRNQGSKHVAALARALDVSADWLSTGTGPRERAIVSSAPDLGSRLQDLIDSGQVDPAQLAAECGVTRQAISGWIRTGKIAKDHLPVLARLSGKPLEWWLGAHIPTISGVSGITLPAITIRPITTYNSLDELPPESTVLVTRVDVGLSAGPGRHNWHVEEREPLPFQSDWIKHLSASPKNLVAVKVVGDSMEPRLFDGDTVLVDTADKRIPAQGGVFALIYAAEMLVKRLFQLPDGSIRVVSDNKEKHEPFVLAADNLEHIEILGRVKYRSGTGDF
ncbi:S24 family peptidase [Cupriavidus gilardii]|uniref:S24 family peptidase n=1 Tax=Cupriavidus gilardii TaxID=82541 RepID=UPI003B969C8A